MDITQEVKEIFEEEQEKLNRYPRRVHGIDKIRAGQNMSDNKK